VPMFLVAEKPASQCNTDLRALLHSIRELRPIPIDIVQLRRHVPRASRRCRQGTIYAMAHVSGIATLTREKSRDIQVNVPQYCARSANGQEAGPALRHRPGVQGLGADMADGDVRPIAIDVASRR
jgi:hypothetical protein